MVNSPLSQSITKLIAENISLVNQVTKHFEETQVLSKQGNVPFQHMAKLYELLIGHQNKVKKPSYFLLENLGKEVAHG